MARVTVNITTKPFLAPAGTVPGAYRYTLLQLGSAETITMDVDGVSATFEDVPGGFAYTPKARRVDANGAPIGNEIAGFDFFVPVPPAAAVSTFVPESISITLG